MSIIETMAEALTAALKLRGVSVTAGGSLVMARAALRAIEPGDVSDAPKVFWETMSDNLSGETGDERARRAIAAGAEQ